MAIYRDRPCPICNGMRFTTIVGENSIGCSRCEECQGTGFVQVAITNGDRIRELDNVGLRKVIRGLLNTAVYSGDPVRLLNIEDDQDLQEWLDKESNEHDYIIFEGGFD